MSDVENRTELEPLDMIDPVATTTSTTVERTVAPEVPVTVEVQKDPSIEQPKIPPDVTPLVGEVDVPTDTRVLEDPERQEEENREDHTGEGRRDGDRGSSRGSVLGTSVSPVDSDGRSPSDLSNDPSLTGTPLEDDVEEEDDEEREELQESKLQEEHLQPTSRDASEHEGRERTPDGQGTDHTSSSEHPISSVSDSEVQPDLVDHPKEGPKEPLDPSKPKEEEPKTLTNEEKEALPKEEVIEPELGDVNEWSEYGVEDNWETVAKELEESEGPKTIGDITDGTPKIEGKEDEVKDNDPHLDPSYESEPDKVVEPDEPTEEDDKDTKQPTKVCCDETCRCPVCTPSLIMPEPKYVRDILKPVELDKPYGTPLFPTVEHDKKFIDIKDATVDISSTEDKDDKKPILTDKEEQVAELATYVFSKAWYLGDTSNMTPIELETYKFIRGEQLNLDVIMGLYKEFSSWSTKEQYYYIPILVILMKDYLASIKTQV